MMKMRKRDGLSLSALFFSLFFCGASGLYIYDVRNLSSLALYILVSLVISLVATLGAGKQSGNIRLYFENGIGKGTASFFCGLLCALTAASLACDALALCLRISDVYGGYESAVLIIIAFVCLWAAVSGAGAVSGGAQICIIIAAVLAPAALLSESSLMDTHAMDTHADAYGALRALGGMGAVFCLISHTYCGGDPDITEAFGARSKVPENRALSVLAVSGGAFLLAGVFHAAVCGARYSDGMKIFFIFAQWLFSFVRLGAYAFTLRDCAETQRSAATKTAVYAVLWLACSAALAALASGGYAEGLLLEISAVIHVFFLAMLAADVLFLSKKSRRGVTKKR